jgi:putative PIN family toxin of toxin-antitoxin system
MRVVLDTNVLMSGIFFRGIPSQIMEAWHKTKYELVISVEIFEEYQRVANRLNQKYPGIDIDRILHLIFLNSTVVDTDSTGIRISEDQDDDKFITCAKSAEAEVIVSGDHHLLDIGEYSGIKILRPADFAREYVKKS